MSMPAAGPLKSSPGELENRSIRRVLVQWVGLQKQATTCLSSLSRAGSRQERGRDSGRRRFLSVTGREAASAAKGRDANARERTRDRAGAVSDKTPRILHAEGVLGEIWSWL